MWPIGLLIMSLAYTEIFCKINIKIWMMTDTAFYSHFLVVSNYMYIQIGSIQPNRKRIVNLINTFKNNAPLYDFHFSV